MDRAVIIDTLLFTILFKTLHNLKVAIFLRISAILRYVDCRLDNLGNPFCQNLDIVPSNFLLNFYIIDRVLLLIH